MLLIAEGQRQRPSATRAVPQARCQGKQKAEGNLGYGFSFFVFWLVFYAR